MRGDRGDIVVGWLVRIVACLTVFGVVAFDLVAVGLTHVSAQDHATAAATEASELYQATHDVQRAYAAAVRYADEHEATVRPADFRAHPDGRVQLRLRKSATTLLLFRLGPLRKLVDVTAAASVKAVPAS